MHSYQVVSEILCIVVNIFQSFRCWQTCNSSSNRFARLWTVIRFSNRRGEWIKPPAPLLYITIVEVPTHQKRNCSPHSAENSERPLHRNWEKTVQNNQLPKVTWTTSPLNEFSLTRKKITKNTKYRLPAWHDSVVGQKRSPADGNVIETTSKPASLCFALPVAHQAINRSYETKKIANPARNNRNFRHYIYKYFSMAQSIR